MLQELVECASPEMGARLRAAVRRSPVRTFTGEPGWLRRPYGPGWTLVGGAGFWKDPISAHGLTDALRDAELVVGTILEELAEPGCGVEPYRFYERTRDRLTRPILEGADVIAAMEWDEARIVELLRGLNAAMNDELELIFGPDQPTRCAVPHDLRDR